MKNVVLAFLGGFLSALVAVRMISEDHLSDCGRARLQALRQAFALDACFAAPRCETTPADIERMLRSIEAAERVCPEEKPEGDRT